MGNAANDRNLTIVIPAYNEALAIGSVLEQVKSACGGIVREIIVVDDGSSDGTAEIAADNDMVTGNRTQFIHSSLWRMPGKWLLGRICGQNSQLRLERFE